jgi:hypothetical protein
LARHLYEKPVIFRACRSFIKFDDNNLKPMDKEKDVPTMVQRSYFLGQLANVSKVLEEFLIPTDMQSINSPSILCVRRLLCGGRF